MLVSTQLQCYRTRPGVPIQAQHEPKQQVAQVTTCNRLGAPRCCPIQPSLRRIRCCNTNYGVSSRKRMTIITCASIRSSPPLVVDRMAVKTFLLNQFVPIGLIVAILVGTFAPHPGAHAAKYGVLRIATTGIFFISGLNLKHDETKRALSAWGAVLYGLTSILLLTPFLVGLIALRLPLQPSALSFGLALFCCMPTTLSSGQCEGNTALALLLTVGSNLIGVFTMPFVLLAVIGAATSNLSISPVQLLTSLVQCILVPLMVGAACRATIPGLAGWVDRNKKGLQLANGTLLCSTPWTQVSVAVLQGNTLPPASIASLLICSVAIHAVMFAFNSMMVRVIKLGGDGYEARHIRRAVVLCASQKTLPVAISILEKLSGVLGGQVGLAVIPCVISHMAQIVVDSMIVSRWIKQDKEHAIAAARCAAKDDITTVSVNGTTTLQTEEVTVSKEASSTSAVADSQEVVVVNSTT